MRCPWPTFGVEFRTEVPVAEWAAARQALGIALRDDAKWLKEVWGGHVDYDDIGLYSYSIDQLADKLNSILTGYSFETIASNSAEERYNRFAVAVDRENRTFVVATGDREFGGDDAGLMVVVGEKAAEVADAINDNCGGGLSKRGERLLGWMEQHPGGSHERLPVAGFLADPVRLKVRAGNFRQAELVTEFKIDRW